MNVGQANVGKVIHGHSFNGKVSPEFTVWAGILDRCLNANARAYKDYGGRGIKVCERWATSFINFYTDMGPRPDGQSLDRIDNDGNYGPDNCRWATRTEQNRNTRRNIMIEHDGKRLCLTEWAGIVNIKIGTLYQRIVLNKWPIKDALTVPVRALKGANV